MVCSWCPASWHAYSKQSSCRGSYYIKHSARYFWQMLEQGVYLPPSQFEACFLSLALEDSMLEETIIAVETVLHRLSQEA